MTVRRKMTTITRPSLFLGITRETFRGADANVIRLWSIQDPDKHPGLLRSPISFTDRTCSV